MYTFLYTCKKPNEGAANVVIYCLIYMRELRNGIGWMGEGLGGMLFGGYWCGKMRRSILFICMSAYRKKNVADEIGIPLDKSMLMIF